VLRDHDKLLFLASSQNWMELPLLLSFVRVADFVAGKMRDALSAAGLSLTQAMICSELADFQKQNRPRNVGLSLKDVSTRLAAPRNRLHPQLQELIAMGIVRSTARTVNESGRGPGYVLTAKGFRRYEVFVKHADDARAEVAWLLFHRGRKRHQAWAEISELVTKHLAGNDDSA
jgi:DNA-binding MarR family transcriptional regulator